MINKTCCTQKKFNPSIKSRMILKTKQKAIRFQHWYEYRNKKKKQTKIYKNIFKLMNSAFFGKTMKNIGNNRNIKLITTEASKNYLLSGRNCHTTKDLFWIIISNRNEKTQTFISKSVYLTLTILEIWKTVIYLFWYEYVKPK